jgi:hypothetical protein
VIFRAWFDPAARQRRSRSQQDDLFSGDSGRGSYNLVGADDGNADRDEPVNAPEFGGLLSRRDPERFGGGGPLRGVMATGSVAMIAAS